MIPETSKKICLQTNYHRQGTILVYGIKDPNNIIEELKQIRWGDSKGIGKSIRGRICDTL